MAALIALGVAVAFPIIALDIKGTQVQTTLLGAAEALYEDRMTPLAALVIATTVLYPVLALLLMAMKPSRHLLQGVLRAVQPWCMVEVFLLGMLVAYAKLAHMVPTTPGAGALALAAFVVLWALMQRELSA